MLAKKTSKNQITIPKAIANHYPGVEYFEIREENNRIVLIPLKPSRSDEVRKKLKQLDISEDDVKDAINWARKL